MILFLAGTIEIKNFYRSFNLVKKIPTFLYTIHILQLWLISIWLGRSLSTTYSELEEKVFKGL